MATLIPPSSNVEAAYEDMFKEITRKLYGEETGNGLHTLGTPVAQVATTGPTAPEGERSFTNLQIDRSAAPTIEYEHNAAAGGANNAAAAAVTAAAANAQAANVVIQQPEGSVVVATTGGAVTAGGGGNFKSEDHLSTAFGLAALMQNGFATTGTILSTQAINKVVTNAAAAGQQQQQNTSVTVVTDPQQQRWSTEGNAAAGSDQQQQQPQIVQWTTTGGKLQSYTTTQQQQQQQQQVATAPKSKSKSRNDHSTAVSTTSEVIYASPSTSGNTIVGTGPNQAQQQNPTAATVVVSGANTTGGGGGNRKKNTHHNNQQNGAGNNGGIQIQKRYPCTHCPYSTDRRDLYTRHENIHKDEKPFQCYACLKQFNRADHVKKHFLRMHREMQYDINKTRRHVPSGSNAHGGGRSNVTITTVSSSSSSASDGSNTEQKPNIFQATNVHLDNAFLESQRQPTSSSLSIAETIEAVASAADAPLPQLKQEKNDDCAAMVGGVGVGANGSGNLKPKREKRFTCCYCPWSGADKWGLKRHLNTHTKPFVCLLCDYKAARSERLATHVLKVHNKRACNKCSFLADTQEEYQVHISEVHPHDTRPARNNSTNSINSNNSSNNVIINEATNNLNVLRTIGNTLVTNNQINTFQNAGTFGVGSTGNNNNNSNTTTTNVVGNAGGSVTIYTTTTTNDNGSGNLTGGPLQEIIVNPTSMVGWRLSANGSLIPPHDLLTGGLPNAAAQKRGSERLFQYLEADGSDPEDYARLLKMDAISRNTASVAQDFHKAGGVHELKIPANHQLLFNNKLPSQWTTKEAAALLYSLNNTNFVYQQQQQQQKPRSQPTKYQQQNGAKRQRQHSTGEESATSTNSSDDGTTSPVKSLRTSSGDDRRQNVAAKMAEATATATASEQRKAMSAFLGKNFDLQETTITAVAQAKEIATSSDVKNKQPLQQQVVIKMEMFDEEDQENQEQLIKSPPAYINNNNSNHNHKTTFNYKNKHNNKSNSNSNSNNRTKTTSNNQRAEHRLNLYGEKDDKENANNAAATFLTSMEYQNLNKIGTQFQNYVKDIISKYYAEAPLMFPAMPTPTATAQQSQQQQQQQQQQRLQQQQQQHQSPPKRKRMRSETEEYIEYLKNKEDITLTITPKVTAVAGAAANSNGNVRVGTGSTKVPSPLKRQQDLSLLRRQSPKKLSQQHAANASNAAPQSSNTHNNKARKSLSHLATLLPLLADAASKQEYLAAPLDFSKKQTVAQSTQQQQKQPQSSSNNTNKSTQRKEPSAAAQDKRSSRKQAQPKKIRAAPEVVVAMLRDKYLNRMVVPKLGCRICANEPQRRNTMLVFNYHTKGSLALHRHWKHSSHTGSAAACRHCPKTFKHRYSLGVHCRCAHAKPQATPRSGSSLDDTGFLCVKKKGQLRQAHAGKVY